MSHAFPLRIQVPPGQINNSKFQRDSLAQSLGSSFPNLSPVHCMLRQGTDDTCPGRLNALSKAKVVEVGRAQPDLKVKLSGSTCCKAIMIQDACGFLSGRMRRRDRLRQQSDAHLLTAVIKRREAFTRLAGKCHDLAPISRSSQFPTLKRGVLTPSPRSSSSSVRSRTPTGCPYKLLRSIFPAFSRPRC